MKIETTLALAAALAFAPSAIGQRRQSGGDGKPQQSVIQRAPERPNLPTSPILPMTNPIAPMTNPVAPIIRYGPGGTPSVVIPQQQDRPRDNRSDDRRGDDRRGDDRRGDDRRGDDRNRRDRDPVIVLGGPYIDPFFYPPYYNQPVVAPPTVPGSLPGTATYSSPQPVVIYVPVPGAPAAAAEPNVPEQPAAASEPRMIIVTPEPEQVVVPPAPGTTRAEVLMRYGQPWGSIVAQGKETLYFRNLTLVLQDGKVAEVR